MATINGIDDRELSIPEYSEICTFCRHNTGKRACSAFKGKIPMPIWMGTNDHTEPYPGDNGIRFEPLEDAEG